jgi:hypothetical protein
MSTRRLAGSPVAVVLATLTLVTLAAVPVDASCAEGSDDPSQGARSVFTGTVDRLWQRGSIAAITVDQVWKGPDLAPTVGVLAGQRQPPFPLSVFTGVGGSADVELDPGRRYLFVVATEALEFRIDACSGPDDPAAIVRAPADAREPVPGGYAGEALPAGFATSPLGLVAGGGLLLAGAAVRRLRRSR